MCMFSSSVGPPSLKRRPTGIFFFKLHNRRLTNGNEVSHSPKRVGELSYVHFYTFLGTGDYQQKRDPTGVFFMFLDSLKLRELLSIYFLGLVKNSQDRAIMVSLGAIPYVTVWHHSYCKRKFPMARV